MGQDVASILRQYEDAPDREPMHGRVGEIRRAPSTDQKRVRREMQRKADLEDPTVTDQPQTINGTVASLLGQAARAETHEERVRLITEAERLRTVAMQQADDGRGFEVAAAVLRDVTVPGFTHERTTADSDWLLGLQTTASLDDANQEMVVQAGLWFNRVAAEIKAYPEEYAEQARNLGHRLASQYGDVSDKAERTFLDEAARLHTQAVRAGQVEIAKEAEIDPEVGGFTYDAASKTDPVKNAEDVIDENKDGDGPDAREKNSKQKVTAAFGDEHVTNYVAWAKQNGHDPDDVETLKRYEKQPGIGRSHTNHLADQLYIGGGDSDWRKQAASGLPQVAQDHVPDAQFSALQPDSALPPQATSSDRAPALQEIQNFQGWNGTSVVPPNDQHAENDNDDTSGAQDASVGNGISTGFPVGASLHSKESSMAQGHAQCPTCGGQGKVAVRTLDPREAYSGLPQIDQIVNADETPATTPYPAEVAFPITWDGNNVPAAINQAEQQINQRNQQSPLVQQNRQGPPPANSRSAAQHEANGRDNSGWMGDNGAKGTDYPGYSTPSGYDGSSNLGQPDPVYGEGGDNGNQPLKPYGAAEADDRTNNPGQNWQPGQPTQNDQGYREVSPGMNTQGSFHSDPYIAAAQRQIVLAQQAITARNSQLQGR